MIAYEFTDFLKPSTKEEMMLEEQTHADEPKASLVWITPNAEQMIVDIARVSSDKPAGTEPGKLIRYLIEHKHWSPFEMANICIRVSGVPRDITRQILRHRSFHFQEFSQRYADTTNLGDPIYRECRMQNPKNRQKSLVCDDPDMQFWWRNMQEIVANSTRDIYTIALEKGIAKEVARAILPEGMTPTRMYINGTIRDWLHYIGVRWHEDTQKEHYIIAELIWEVLTAHLPAITHTYIETTYDL